MDCKWSRADVVPLTMSLPLSELTNKPWVDGIDGEGPGTVSGGIIGFKVKSNMEDNKCNVENATLAGKAMVELQSNFLDSELSASIVDSETSNAESVSSAVRCRRHQPDKV